MKVYVLEQEIAYEGSWIISVNETLEGAQQNADLEVLQFIDRSDWYSSDWSERKWPSRGPSDAPLLERAINETYMFTITELGVEA